MVSYNVSKENLEESKKVSEGKRPKSKVAEAGGRHGKDAWDRPSRLRNAVRFFRFRQRPCS